MDSIIPLGQKNTLVEYMILSGTDNRPPMLDKDLYDSWKIRMELYMQNRENGRMILESVENGPLIWPTIEENGVTRTKKYAELSATEKIQADCDMKETNIILQGLPADIYLLERECKLYDAFDRGFVNFEKSSLPLEWSKFVTDVKLVKDLHTTNYDQLHAYLEQHKLHGNEVLPVFKQGDEPIDVINKMMSFQSNFITLVFPSTKQSAKKTPSNHTTTIQLIMMTGHMARQCSKLKRKRDATWFRDKILLVEAQGKGKVLNEEELEFLANPGIVKVQLHRLVITPNAVYQAILDANESDCDRSLQAKCLSYGQFVRVTIQLIQLRGTATPDNTHNDKPKTKSQENAMYSEQTHLVNYHPRMR
ncbi:hypothetical protein Tco_0686928 [Tanacetum coccineum]